MQAKERKEEKRGGEEEEEEKEKEEGKRMVELSILLQSALPPPRSLSPLSPTSTTMNAHPQSSARV